MASTLASPNHTPVDDLRLGRSKQFVVCRLLHFWDSKNIKKQCEFMGITLLLLDSKSSNEKGKPYRVVEYGDASTNADGDNIQPDLAEEAGQVFHEYEKKKCY
ncbi:unnamed protein product [Cochlearia groenlandica]